MIGFANIPNNLQKIFDAYFHRKSKIAISMEVGQVSETVTVTGEATPIVDVTQSKVAVTVDKDLIDQMPKGRSFQSLIAFAPGAR